MRLKDRRALLAHFRAAGVGGEAGAAKMVAVEIREHAALPHGHALTARVVKGHPLL